MNPIHLSLVELEALRGALRQQEAATNTLRAVQAEVLRAHDLDPEKVALRKLIFDTGMVEVVELAETTKG